MPQRKETWAIILRGLCDIRQILAGHALRHKHTVVGRTHGQQARPIAFGYMLAVRVDAIDRHLERCAEAERRLGLAPTLVEVVGVGDVGGGNNLVSLSRIPTPSP